jgi:uncharacterized BrkB/YihY/UPF0761 family membrane protein
MRIGRDNLKLVATGVAFSAMTAIFPAIAAFVSIYSASCAAAPPSSRSSATMRDARALG